MQHLQLNSRKANSSQIGTTDKCSKLLEHAWNLPQMKTNYFSPQAKYLFSPPKIHTFSHTFSGSVLSGPHTNWSQQKSVRYQIFKGNLFLFSQSEVVCIKKLMEGSQWSPWKDSLTYEEGQNPSLNIQYKLNWTVGKVSSAETCIADTQGQSLFLLIPYTASSSVY